MRNPEAINTILYICAIRIMLTTLYHTVLKKKMTTETLVYKRRTEVTLLLQKIATPIDQ